MISIYWLVAGAVLLALEAFGLPGIGFMFAGLAAILVGGLVELGLIDSVAFITQWAVFFITTTLLTALLWKKLKAWRMNPDAPVYSNIIGTEATVTQPLIGDAIGEVRWSGTLMRARLAPGTATELPVGTTVIVRVADGTILLVAPK